jgi:hypothetical protein
MGSGPVLTMAEIDKLRIYVYVPEEEAGFIRVGTHAVVTAHSSDAEPIEARVARYANSLDLSTRTMLTEIDLNNAQHKLGWMETATIVVVPLQPALSNIAPIDYRSGRGMNRLSRLFPHGNIKCVGRTSWTTQSDTPKVAMYTSPIACLETGHSIWC